MGVLRNYYWLCLWCGRLNPSLLNTNPAPNLGPHEHVSNAFRVQRRGHILGEGTPCAGRGGVNWVLGAGERHAALCVQSGERLEGLEQAWSSQG